MTRLATDSPPIGGREVRTAMIEADGLSKFYGDFAACRDVTFTINRARWPPSSAPTAPARARR